jgi:hypothetical protein
MGLATFDSLDRADYLTTGVWGLFFCNGTAMENPYFSYKN